MSDSPTSEDQQQERSRPSRYSDLEQHELIHLLDEVDDERSRARFRESVYIAVIVWLLFLGLLRWGPSYLWRQPHIITEVRPDEQKQFTMLNLPPDMVKKIPRTKPAPQIAERDQVGQSPKPSPEAPNPSAGERTPPSPQPRPQNTPQSPQPTPQPTTPQPQQQPQNQPKQQPQTQPRPTQQPPLADAPHPNLQQPTRPNFSMNSAGESIRQATQGGRSGGGSRSYGDYGTGPTKNGGTTGTQILSDTQGVDFGKYLQRLLHDVKRNWDPLIPEECKPPILKQGITGIRFTINRDGSIASMNLDYKSGDVAIDKAAWGAITALGQAQPLPPEFHGPNLTLRIEFRVNKDVEAH